MWQYIKNLIRFYKEVRKSKKVLYSGKYYTEINLIPFFNWWKCSEGDFRYLWKEFDNYIPIFFKRIFEDMYFQLDYIDLSDLRKMAEANYYQNKYLVTKDIKYKRKADTKYAEINGLKRVQSSDVKMNDIIKFVQTTLNLTWQIDATKISAGYFMSLYTDANKKLEYGNN